jgi:uncharacterized membrane-anchored protein YitT (DUF2179 family)
LIIFAASCLSAVGLHMFINPAGFAPSGVDGIATMLDSMFGINMGYTSLLFNVPLLIVAWFLLNKKYVVYTLTYTVTSSLLLILAERIDLYQYVTETNTWLAVVTSGFLLGLRTGLLIKHGGSSGGIDIVACIIQKKRPYFNVETLISIISYLIIGVSFFVYGNLESILMSITQTVVFNFTMNAVLKPTRNAIEVKIITNNAEELKQDILHELKHGATVLKCRGMYTDDERDMVVTLINIRQLNELMQISRKYPNSFIYYDNVNGVWGNFRWNKFDAVM